jgi:drug/metabolite transporter (DMT)-like permease
MSIPLLFSLGGALLLGVFGGVARQVRLTSRHWLVCLLSILLLCLMFAVSLSISSVVIAKGVMMCSGLLIAYSAAIVFRKIPSGRRAVGGGFYKPCPTPVPELFEDGGGI